MEERVYTYSKFCGLLGYPIKHTLSPLMHNLSFDYHSIDWVYLPFEVEPDDFEKAVVGLKAAGAVGFNVTMPFKELVIKLLDDVDDEVKKMGAVNTVKIINGKMIGYNTDHRGFFRTFEIYRDDIEGEKVLIFGAGGAAKAVLYSLLHRFEPESILILDILEDKIDNLRMLIKSWNVKSVNISFDLLNRLNDLEERIKKSKLIINATPVGMTPNIQNSIIDNENNFRNEHIIYDLVYNPLKTALQKKAEKMGAVAIGGLDMLIYQGAEAFKIWTGKDMPVEKVKEKLESALK
ncbi:MAG: shikimate dehydrogenase [Candidatus Helarchaeota archaeon]|nr:shikimate dehydrogenase [Candidatus Helarchaeota archaeon]